jgi:hypothetical protein
VEQGYPVQCCCDKRWRWNTAKRKEDDGVMGVKRIGELLLHPDLRSPNQGCGWGYRGGWCRTAHEEGHPCNVLLGSWVPVEDTILSSTHLCDWTGVGAVLHSFLHLRLLIKH